MTTINAVTLAVAMLLIGLVVGGFVVAIRQHLREARQLMEELAAVGPEPPADAPAWTGPPPELDRHNDEKLPAPELAAGWRARLPEPRREEITQGRQAGLHEGMERVRNPDDTQSWRIDAATGALIAPRHTRYFDWPEVADLFRPVPAGVAKRQRN